MNNNELIAEIRKFISEEKERWKKHRDRNIMTSHCYAEYNGRVWMLGALQEKLKRIVRRKSFKPCPKE